MRARRPAAVAAVVVGLTFGAAPASAYTVADPAFDVEDWGTGFASASGVGPTGVTVGPDRSGYAADATDGYIYKFGHNGGVASVATRLNSTPLDAPADIQFTSDHRLYALQRGVADNIVELDPADGSIIRTVASSLQAPAGLAQDPIGGDLFVSELGAGRVDRISNLTAATPTVTPYATGIDSPAGMAFGPDGTLYVAEATNTGASVWGVSGTGTAHPGAKPLDLPFSNGTRPTGLGVGDGFLLVVQGDGRVVKVDLGGLHTHTDVITGATGGDLGKVGIHGCFYATQADRVVRILSHGGTCSMRSAVRYDGAPVAVTGTPTGVSARGASLRATVNPNGPPTRVHFEYGASAAYGSATPDTSLAAATANRAVSAALSRLEPRMTYHYRVVASNAQGATLGADQSFTTAGLPVCALTLRSRKVSRRRVRLTASCDQAATGVVTGFVKITGRKRRRLKRVALVLEAGRPAAVSLRLPRKVLAALRANARVSASFVLVAANGNGLARSKIRIRRLKRP